MADGYISQIKTPDNKVYLLKDSEKTDEKVAQVGNAEDKDFPIILKNTNNTTDETANVKYSNNTTTDATTTKPFTFNPSTGTLKVTQIKIGTKDDSKGLFPVLNNWNQIGASNLYWYRSYISNYYGERSHVNNWDSGKNIGTAATSSAAATKGTVNFYNTAAANATQTKTLLEANASTNSNITVTLPSSTGTLALTSQIPTNLNQLTNGPGYVTSSGITSVTISATSPVQSSTATAQTGSSASTTISLADAYGDTKNPYGAKAKNLVLAGPSSGNNAAPTFRALVAADIPNSILKWQTTTAESTALYDFGVYVNMNNANGSSMNGGNYFNILNVPYRKASGNTKADWGWQLGNTTSNDGRLWYRTSGDNVWGDWQTIAHATQSTSDTGSSSQPVYMTKTGVITAITAVGAAYGGTGKTTLKDSANALINALDTGSSPLTANDYVITQYVGGGTTTTTYHRRPASQVVNSTLVKAALGTVGTTAKKFLKDTGAWAQVAFSDLSGTVTNAQLANSKVTIAGNDVNLGGSLTADTLTSSLGLSNALHFIGITSTALTDGSTTATLTAKSTNSLSKTTGFVDGDVVMDGDQLREYVWSGSAWRLLGITTSTAYTQPASTATNTWIAQVSQGTDGKITATTGSLNTSGTWSGNATTATTATNLANNPSIQTASNSNQITITAGGKTSSAYTVPYATSAGSATSATTATYIKCTDTRNTALNPTDLTAAQGIRFDFKAKGTINLTATDAYAGVMSFRPYASNTDWSGGNAHQLAFNSEGLHWRNGGASWGNWYQILDSNNTAAGANATANMTWGQTYTLAKINGTDIKVTMPSNPNTNTTYTFAEGSTNGAFSVTPSGGSAQSISIHGLGTAAYKAVENFAAASHTHSYLANTNAGAADRPIYITGNAASQTTYRMAGTNVTATTALAITNDLDTGIWYVNGTSSILSQGDGAAYVNKYSNSWLHEIYGDYRTGHIAVRGKNNGTWKDWLKVLDSGNYTDYTVTKTGTGASGTWGISITGSAGSVAWANTGHPSTFPPTIGTTSTTAAAGDHTHTISLTQTGTSTVNLAANTVYTLTAGGSSVVFKTPADGNTDTKVNVTATAAAITKNYLLMTSTAPTSTATGHTALGSASLWVNAVDKGKFELVLGNATAITTAGGQFGQLALYSASTAGTYLKAADGTAWKTQTLQAKDGTIALTSDLPGGVSKTAAGLCPQLPNETTTTKFLRQDGTWQVPAYIADTHYTTHLYVNTTAGGATSNAATANTTTYMHLYDNSTKRETIQFKGSGATTVTATGGVITISSTDNNTATATDNILDGSNSGTAITYAPYTAQQAKLSFDTSTTAPIRTDRLNLNGFLYATKYNVAGHVTLQYNTTDQSLDFIF